MKRNVMKLVCGFALAGLFTLNAAAQNAHEVSVTIDKETKTAFQGDYKVSKALMSTTVEDRLKKAGLSKSSKTNGYQVYKGVIFPEISANKVDIYTKVEGKKANASVIMLVSAGYNNFVSTASDAATAANTITFLNKLNEDAVSMQGVIDLSAQQKAIAEAEKKRKKSEDQQAKLAKKKAKLEKQMEEQAKAQEKAAKALEDEKLKLENLKGKNGVN